MYLGKSDKEKDFKAESALRRFGLLPGIEQLLLGF